MEVSMGVGVFGFWMFLAAVVVGGIWSDLRKRESQQETLRRVVESGQTLDLAVIDKMISSGAKHENTDKELKVAGIIVMFAAFGLVILGWGLSQLREDLFTTMLGVAGMVGMVGIGLYVTGKLYEQWQSKDRV